MPQVLVWQCPRTDKLFRGKEEYLRHLRSRAKHSLQERRRAKMLAAFDETVKELHRMSNVNDIIAWLNAHAADLYARNYEHHRYYRDATEDAPFVFEVISLNLRFGSRATTHCAPLKSKPNWHHPEILPAWIGRIKYKIKGFSSWNSIFNGTGVNLGSGGGGNDDIYNHEVTLYDVDFPAMAMMQVLNGTMTID